MPYILMEDSRGSPIFALRETEIHREHISNYPHGSMVIFPLTPPSINPTNIPLPRVNLTGNITKIEQNFESKVCHKFFEIHPGAKQIIENGKFSFFQLNPKYIYFMGGKEYATTEYIEKASYQEAAVDPVAHDSQKILNKINLEEDLFLFCETYGDIKIIKESAFIFFVDRLGFNIIAETEESEQSIKKPGNSWVNMRLPFPYEMASAEECLASLQQSLLELREKK